MIINPCISIELHYFIFICVLLAFIVVKMIREPSCSMLWMESGKWVSKAFVWRTWISKQIVDKACLFYDCRRRECLFFIHYNIGRQCVWHFSLLYDNIADYCFWIFYNTYFVIALSYSRKIKFTIFISTISILKKEQYIKEKCSWKLFKINRSQT